MQTLQDLVYPGVTMQSGPFRQTAEIATANKTVVTSLVNNQLGSTLNNLSWNWRSSPCTLAASSVAVKIQVTEVACDQELGSSDRHLVKRQTHRQRVLVQILKSNWKTFRRPHLRYSTRTALTDSSIFISMYCLQKFRLHSTILHLMY